MAIFMSLYDVYVMENAEYVYVGSAWNKEASFREAIHRSGKGGAPALRDALDAGIELTMRVVVSGAGTHMDAKIAEQAVLDDDIARGGRKILNINYDIAGTKYGDANPLKDTAKEAARKRWSDPDKAAAAQAAMQAGRFTPTGRENRSRASSAWERTEEQKQQIRTAALGSKRSEEQREHYRQAALKQWSDPEFRSKRIESMRVAREQRNALKQQESETPWLK